MNHFETIMGLIRNERERQRKKFGDAAHDSYDLARWVCVLTEEVGEVAEMSNDIYLGKVQHDDPNLEKEIVQCAAVCVAWLEARSRAKEDRR